MGVRTIGRWIVAAAASVAAGGQAAAQLLDEDTAKASTVRVEVTDRGDVDYVHSGVVIASGHVATVELSVGDSDAVHIIDQDGERREAEVVATDPARGIGILRIEGFEAPAVTFALSEAATGEAATLVYVTPQSIWTSSKGAVGVTPSPEGASMFDHVALGPSSAFGGGVFDACGGLIGVSRPEPGYSRRRFRRQRAPEQVAQAAFAAEVQAVAVSAGLTLAVAAEACDPVVDQAEAAQTEADERAAEVEEKRAEAEARAQEAEAAQARAAAAEARAAELRAQTEATEAEKQAAEEAAEAARAEADAAQRSADLTEADLAEAEAELDAANERIEAQDETIDTLETRVILIAAIGGGVLLIAILIAWLLVRARQKRARTAESQAAASQAEAARAEQEAAELRAVPKAIPPYNDCLLEGAGRNVSLPGALLPEATGGVIVGRHPEKARAVLEAEDVSRAHARFFVRDDVVYLEDLGSSFGTFVRGDQIQQNDAVHVEPGDDVKLASHRFVFRRL